MATGQPSQRRSRVNFSTAIHNLRQIGETVRVLGNVVSAKQIQLNVDCIERKFTELGAAYNELFHTPEFPHIGGLNTDCVACLNAHFAGGGEVCFPFEGTGVASIPEYCPECTARTPGEHRPWCSHSDDEKPSRPQATDKQRLDWLDTQKPEITANDGECLYSITAFKPGTLRGEIDAAMQDAASVHNAKPETQSVQPPSPHTERKRV